MPTQPDLAHIAPDLQPHAIHIDQLHDMEGNPNQGDVEAVAASVHAFGQRKPVIVRRDTNTIEAGHTMVRAIRSLGHEHVAALFYDDDELTAAAFAIADNRTRDLATTHDTALAQLVATIGDSPHLLAATSYDAEDVTS